MKKSQLTPQQMFWLYNIMFFPRIAFAEKNEKREFWLYNIMFFPRIKGLADYVCDEVLTLQHNVLSKNTKKKEKRKKGVLTLQHNVLSKNFFVHLQAQMFVLTLQHNVLSKNQCSVQCQSDSGFDFTT